MQYHSFKGEKFPSISPFNKTGEKTGETGFDLNFISGMAFTSHLTIGCGNDDLMGSGTAPVPEPATIILMGTGLLGIAGIGRKKLKKSHTANG